MRSASSRTRLLTLAPALVAALFLFSAPASAAPETHTNSIGMEFVLIPAGTFQMGCSPEVEEWCDDDEMPRHQVTISRPFYLARHEVTQAQWEAVMGDRPKEFKGGSNHPAHNVTWNETREFIKKLNAKEGHTRYRLPTEAEWEYAARAGNEGAYCFGNDKERLGDYAWIESNSGDQPHPVGKKLPNAWGLHDMHGNVYEWVQDQYDAKHYTAEAAVDPLAPEKAGWNRSMRGGGWNNGPKGCRSAHRVGLPPDYRFGLNGFRLALSPEN